MLVPTIDDLLALPYGTTNADEGPLTTDQLLALDYIGGPAFSRGLTGQSYRERMRANGEPLDWLRALESTSLSANRQGKVFIDQYLPDEDRAFIYQNERTIQTEEFGEITAGTMMLAWMQDEIFPVRDDRFRAPLRTFNARQVLKPSSDHTRALDHKYTISIDAVYVNDELVSPVHYALVSGGLMWINGYLPDVAAVVLTGYRPVYELLGETFKQGPMGQDGVRLPSSAPLRLLSGEEE